MLWLAQMFASRLLLFPDRFWGRELRKVFAVWFGAFQNWGHPLPWLSPAALCPSTSPGLKCHGGSMHPPEWGQAPMAALWRGLP